MFTSVESKPVQPVQNNYGGTIVYVFAYDIAYEMKRQMVPQLMGEPLQQFSVGISKRTPRQPFFYQPQMVRLPKLSVQCFGRQADVERTIKLFAVGAISISYRVPVQVQRLEDLVKYHEVLLEGQRVPEAARKLAEEAFSQLKPYCIRPVQQLRDAEAYTVFHIRPPYDGQSKSISGEGWLAGNRREIAAVLTQEENLQTLSEQEVIESTANHLTYYDSDLVVADWDAAIVIDEPESFEETLHVMELANVQLEELEEYDRILDVSLEQSYRDLSHRRLLPKGTVLQDLREIRVDMARLSDELFNISKFFGDWHLARIYQGISIRFHLQEWQKVIDDKLKTLADLYTIIKQDQLNFWMMALEVTIVLLFIIDLIVLVVLPSIH